MKILIENEINDNNSVTYLEFGFGRYSESDFVEYLIVIPKDEFIDNFNEVFDVTISELKRDDLVTGVFEPPYPNAKDYPKLNEFIEINGKYFGEHISDFHTFDIFSYYFSEESLTSKYCLRTVDIIEVNGGDVLIKGKASVKQPSDINKSFFGKIIEKLLKLGK